jgi:hypothetical protein
LAVPCPSILSVAVYTKKGFIKNVLAKIGRKTGGKKNAVRKNVLRKDKIYSIGEK